MYLIPHNSFLFYRRTATLTAVKPTAEPQILRQN